MGFILWIIIGGIVGWLASLVMRTDGQQGILLNIVVGIVGAFIGGTIYKLISGEDWNFEFNIPSFAVAVGGSIVLLVLLRTIRR